MTWKTCAFAALTMTLLTGTLAVADPAEAAPVIKLGRIQYDSPGRDSRTNRSLNAEWVTVRNTGRKPVQLEGFTLRDAAGKVYRFGKLRLAPGARVRVHTGRGSNTRQHVYWRQGNYVWNNTGDTATLRRRDGTRIDQCRYQGGGTYVDC